MAALHQNAHRLSLEWSRLEPEPGRFDDGAVARYRQMLAALRGRRIAPLVTLQHFTLPLWAARAGGWENPAAVGWFRRYARRCVEWFGDLVTEWTPINEPNVVVGLGYLRGQHPPGARNPLRARRAVPNLLRAHAAAYHEIRAAQPAGRIGVAHNVRLFDPARPSAPDRWAAALLDRSFNWVWLDVLSRGEGRSALWSGRLAECVGTMDFVGVNYYTRDLVRFAPWRPDLAFARTFPTPGATVSDGGYGEVYPDGMRRSLVDVHRRYGLPVVVTENGLPDADDDLRPRFLVSHLAAVARAIAEGVPVTGYYHWSLVDNFEWAEGWTLRFGLIAVDPATQRRAPRPSAALYAEICRTGSLPAGAP